MTREEIQAFVGTIIGEKPRKRRISTAFSVAGFIQAAWASATRSVGPIGSAYRKAIAQILGDNALDEWSSPSFEPAVRGKELFGRGASDDKGKMFTRVTALDALQTKGGLPVNMKCLFEGEKEIGTRLFYDH